MERIIEPTVNFHRLANNWDKYKGFVLEGSSRSSKTYSILQWIVVQCLKGEERVIVGRDTLKNIKKTLYPTLRSVLNEFGVPYTMHSTEHIYYIGNSTIEFIYFDSSKGAEANARGLESTLLYFNEANKGLSRYTFNQLLMRCTGKVIADLNPSEIDHWIYELQARDEFMFIHSTFRDNPYISEEAKRELEGYEPTPENIDRKTADEFLYNVYNLGKRMVGEAQVFKTFNIYDKEPSVYDWMYFGLDFGFMTDPNALVSVKRAGGNLYIREYIYGAKGNTNQEIANIIKSINVPIKLDNDTISNISQLQKELIVCDSAEQKSIKELRLAGLNVTPAKKGAGSVYQGIQLMKNFNIFIHKESLNLLKEFRNYKFETDDAGNLMKNSLGQPVVIDKYNHLLDASRYVCLKFIHTI